MDRFSIKTTGEGARVTVSAAGEIDLAVSEALWEALDQQIVADRTVLLDCTNVTFLDSMGLRTLIKAAHRADEVGGELRLVAVPAPIRRVLDLAGVTDVFTVEDGDS